MALDPFDEHRSVRLRQRLWGASVLIALAVIVLPLLLDGSGSESQFRRVERLREEPPRIVDENPPEEEPPVEETSDSGVAGDQSDVEIVFDSNPAQQPNLNSDSGEPTSGGSTNTLNAWVVQAGSFKEEDNAIVIRDRLRQEGFPSFISPLDASNTLYRVQVGPMINKQQAITTRERVDALIGRDAIVVSYP